MAWIATEAAPSTATDRVADIESVVAAQRALDRPVKDAIETSTGRVPDRVQAARVHAASSSIAASA